MARRKKLHSLPGGGVHTVEVEKLESGYRISSAEAGWHAWVSRAPESGVWSILSATGESHEATVQRENGEIQVRVGHRRFRFGAGGEPENVGARRGSASRLEVRAPMPGKVVQVLVSPGETVVTGQAVLLFEAMKMQNELRAPQDGVVGDVAVVPEQAVEARELLYVLNAGS